MKKLKCEMCGSTDFVKEDGLFVCQSCGIKYSLEEAKKLMVEGTVKIDKTDEVHNLLKRAFMHLEEGKWADADKLLDKILNQSPENAQAYVGKLMIELKLKKEKELNEIPISFDKSIYYERIMQFGDEELKKKILEYANKEKPIGSIDQIASSKNNLKKGAKQVIINSEIKDSAFNGCHFLEKVIILNGVKSIPEAAFCDCDSLVSVLIPDSVTSIGDYAFGHCTRLANVTIGNGLTNIGQSAFVNCNSLSGVYITDLDAWCNITYDFDGDSPLRYAKKLYLNGKLITELVIPDGVTSIGEFSFRHCTSLTSIKIPESVTSIGKEAFYGCSLLTSIIIPDSVTNIGECAFGGCNSLTNVTISNSVTNLSDGVFAGCSGLTNVAIPNSVTSIGVRTFSFCTSLTSIIIPDSVTSIGESAFSHCTGLISIEIPDSVTSIGESTFSHCTGLTSITIPASVTNIANYLFLDCWKLASVTIQDGVKSICKEAFAHCGITRVIIPNSITSIGERAFDNYEHNTVQIEYKGTTEQLKTLLDKKSIYWFLHPSSCLIHCADTDEIKAREEAEKKARLKQAWKNAGFCQHCGGSFKGFFTPVCKSCGKKKDY